MTEIILAQPVGQHLPVAPVPCQGKEQTAFQHGENSPRVTRSGAAAAVGHRGSLLWPVCRDRLTSGVLRGAAVGSCHLWEASSFRQGHGKPTPSSGTATWFN